MATLKNVLFALSYVSFVMCAKIIPRSSHGDDDDDKLSCNIVTFPCKEPQPRVFYLTDVREDEEWRNKFGVKYNKMRPSSVVLYRCESSGCCQNPEKKCLPKIKQIDHITLTFEYDTPDGKTVIDEVKQVNHTECVCRKEN